MRVKDGARYVLVGSMGGAPTNPVWVYKLRTNPAVETRESTALGLRGDDADREQGVFRV